MRGQADPSVTDEKLREAIHIVLKDKIWRFTAKAMLGVVAGSALVGIVVAILVIAGPAVVLGAIVEVLPESVPILAGILSLLRR